MDGMESGDPVRVTDTKSLWSCRPKWRAVKEGKASRKEPGEHSTISTAMACTSIHRVVVSQPRQGLRDNVVQTGRRKRLSFAAQLWQGKPLGRDKSPPEENGCRD